MSTHEEKLARIRKLGDETTLLRRAVIGELSEKIINSAALISGVLGSGGKLLIGGNGGSAADASHFAAEMVVRLTSERNRQALPAIALGTDPSVLTAASNDYGYDKAIARQVEALAAKGDLLFLISTSGNSPNLIEAANVARDRSILATGLLGGKGGKLAKLTDHPLIVPHNSTQRIQEEHAFIIHLLVELVEGDLFR
jgi:D-sedoheptulose 7-phosphate isomerase